MKNANRFITAFIRISETKLEINKQDKLIYFSKQN